MAVVNRSRPPSPAPAKVRVCTVTARLTASERAALDRLARERGLSVSEAVAELVRAAVGSSPEPSRARQAWLDVQAMIRSQPDAAFPPGLFVGLLWSDNGRCPCCGMAEGQALAGKGEPPIMGGRRAGILWEHGGVCELTGVCIHGTSVTL